MTTVDTDRQNASSIGICIVILCEAAQLAVWQFLGMFLWSIFACTLSSQPIDFDRFKNEAKYFMRDVFYFLFFKRVVGEAACWPS